MKKSIRTSVGVPALSVFALAGAFCVHAQALEVDPVVVTGSRMAQPLSNVLPSVSVITRQDIEKSQAPTLADLLQGEAGVEFSRTGGPGSVTSFFLRGQNSVNMVILIDGVRSQVDGGGSLTITDMPLDLIERVEILRGNASALYGEAAIGGVISIFTRRSKGELKPYGSAGLGSYKTRSVSVGYGGEIDDVSLDLNAGKTTSAGFSALNPQIYATANPDRDGTETTYGGARFEKKLSADRVIGWRANAKTSVTDFDSAYDTAGTVHRFKTQTDVVNAFWRESVSDNWLSTLDLSSSNFFYESLKDGMVAQSFGTTNGQYNGHQDSLRWFNTYQLQAASTLNFGLDRSLERYNQINTYDARRQLSGYFAGLTHQQGRWTWQANARRDVVNVEQSASGASSEKDNAGSSYLVGTGYELTHHWRATASLSTGFRTPNASELFGYGGNPDLTPEKHKTQEVGVNYKAEQTLMRVVYFHTQSQNAIVWSESDACSSNCYKNVSQTSNQGAELSLRTLWSGYAIKLSAVTQNPWNVTDNTELTRRAKRYGSADVSRMVQGYEVGTRVYSAGARSDFDYVAYPYVPTTLGGYTLWSFYASRKIDKDWTARIRLDNAFNRDYQLAYGYNTPGRGLYAMLQYHPK
jgi:vitamin B12 transporter